MPKRPKSFQLIGLKGYRPAKGYKAFKIKQSIKQKTLKIRRKKSA